MIHSDAWGYPQTTSVIEKKMCGLPAHIILNHNQSLKLKQLCA